MKIESVLNDYSTYVNKSIFGRYIPYATIENELKKLSPMIDLKIEGKSVEGRNIYSLCFGNGPKKVLAWSQMHGNETTTTKSLFDFLNFISSSHVLAKEMLQSISFKIIPVLNPDGAEAYTRVNANAIDLNRDSVDLSQPESKLLRSIFDTFSPNLCLNLHGQRTIFSAGEGPFTSGLSFLSPAVDASRKITELRKQSMRLIHAIYSQLQSELPKQIARYDDAYNINCIGDYMQTQGVPTVLFEAGHINDYQREDTRKMIWKSYVVTLNALMHGIDRKGDAEAYFSIPFNQKRFFDIILRNCLFGDSIIDIAIQYEELLKNAKIIFLPKIQKINDLEKNYGHNEIDLKAKNIKINGIKMNKRPQINDIWSFITVENKDIVLERG